MVAAEIHAREKLAFSSFNSKSIMNCTVRQLQFGIHFSSSCTYPNPVVLVCY